MHVQIPAEGDQLLTESVTEPAGQRTSPGWSAGLWGRAARDFNWFT